MLNNEKIYRPSDKTGFRLAWSKCPTSSLLFSWQCPSLYISVALRLTYVWKNSSSGFRLHIHAPCCGRKRFSQHSKQEPEIHLNWVVSSHFPPPNPKQWCNQGKWNVPMIALNQPQFLLKFEMGSPFPKVLELMVKDTIQVKVWVLLIMGKPVLNVGYGAKNVHSTIPNAQIKTISLIMSISINTSLTCFILYLLCIRVLPP